MKKITLALLLAASLLGCKKSSIDTAPEPNPVQRWRISTSRTLNPNGHFILQTSSYSDNGLLKKEVSKDESTGLNIIQEYFYVNKIPEYSIISSDYRKISRINYFYANERLVKMDYLEYDQSGISSLTFSRSFEYSGNVLSKIITLSAQGMARYYETFTFSGDNLTEAKTFSSDGIIQDMTEYLYDMEINPYKGNLDKYDQAIGLSKNNVMRVRHTNYNNPAASSDRRYEYEYNPEKFPLKKSFIAPTSRELQITFTYEKY